MALICIIVDLTKSPVTSQIFNLECYTLDHHCIAYFIAFWLILEILRSSRTLGESWGFPGFHIWFSSNYETRILVWIIFHSEKYSYKSIWEEKIWLLQNNWNIGGKILKIKYLILSDFIAILFALEKFARFQNCILGPRNVHRVLIILIRRWKFVLAFLDFYFIF